MKENIASIVTINPVKLWQSEKELNSMISHFKGMASQGIDLDEELKNRGISLSQLPGQLHDIVYSSRMNRSSVKLEIEIPAIQYGMLCAAAVVNRLDSWQEAAEYFLNENLAEWSNRDFKLEQ
jgi:hypothetical protein